MAKKVSPATVNSPHSRRRFSEEFRRDAAQMLLDRHSAVDVAQRLGLSGSNLLYRWEALHLQQSGPARRFNRFAGTVFGVDLAAGSGEPFGSVARSTCLYFARTRSGWAYRYGSLFFSIRNAIVTSLRAIATFRVLRFFNWRKKAPNGPGCPVACWAAWVSIARVVEQPAFVTLPR